MRKLYEIIKVLQIQKRIVAAKAIHGNTVVTNEAIIVIFYQFKYVLMYMRLN